MTRISLLQISNFLKQFPSKTAVYNFATLAWLHPCDVLLHSAVSSLEKMRVAIESVQYFVFNNID